MPKPLTVNEAAKMMGVTGDFLREALKQEKFDFGAAVKMKKRYAYYINPAAFERYLKGELISSTAILGGQGADRGINPLRVRLGGL